jgi:HEAT repeat protein
MSSALCVAALLPSWAAPAEEPLEQLGEPARTLCAALFPDAQVQRVKKKTKGGQESFDVRLCDALNPNGYAVLIGPTGRLLEEQRHAVAEQEELKVLRFFCLFGALDDQARAQWTAEKDSGRGRQFTLRIEDCPTRGRLKAVIDPSGGLTVTADERLKAQARAGRGRFEATFQLAPSLDKLPAGLKFPSPAAQAPSAEGPGPTVTEAAPVEKPTVAPVPPQPGQEQKAEELDPDVLRKVRKLIQNTLSEQQEDRDKAWKELRDMGNLAVPGLLALYRQPETTARMMPSLLIALGDCSDPRTGPVLTEALQRPEAPIRRDAARAIGSSGYKAAVPALERLSADEREDEEVRLHAASAAAKLGSRQVLSTLEALARSRTPATRARAVFALGKYGGKAHLQTVAGTLADPELTVRLDAVEALRLIGGREAQAALVRALADGEHRVRAAATDALRALTGERPGALLAAALSDPDRRVRLAAAGILAETEYKEALPALKECLARQGEDEEVRLQAARAAARWKAAEGVEALKQLAREAALPLRARALVALGRYGGPQQLDAVAAALNDPQPALRVAAVEALGCVGKTAGGHLVAALKASEAEVREAAHEMLCGLAGEDLGADPAAWERWWAGEKEGKKEE